MFVARNLKRNSLSSNDMVILSSLWRSRSIVSYSKAGSMWHSYTIQLEDSQVEIELSLEVNDVQCYYRLKLEQLASKQHHVRLFDFEGVASLKHSGNGCIIHSIILIHIILRYSFWIA